MTSACGVLIIPVGLGDKWTKKVIVMLCVVCEDVDYCVLCI